MCCASVKFLVIFVSLTYNSDFRNIGNCWYFTCLSLPFLVHLSFDTVPSVWSNCTLLQSQFGRLLALQPGWDGWVKPAKESSKDSHEQPDHPEYHPQGTLILLLAAHRSSWVPPFERTRWRQTSLYLQRFHAPRSYWWTCSKTRKENKSEYYGDWFYMTHDPWPINGNYCFMITSTFRQHLNILRISNLKLNLSNNYFNDI